MKYELRLGPDGDVTIPADWSGHASVTEYVVVTGLISEEFGLPLSTVYTDIDEAIRVVDGIKARGTHWAMFKWREVSVSADEWK